MLGSPAAPVLWARLGDEEAAWPLPLCPPLWTCGLRLQRPRVSVLSLFCVGAGLGGGRESAGGRPPGGQGLPVRQPGPQSSRLTQERGPLSGPTFTSQRLVSPQGRGSERRAFGGGSGAATAPRPLVAPTSGFCDETPSPTEVRRGRSQRQAALSPWTWAPRTAWSVGQASQCQ